MNTIIIILLSVICLLLLVIAFRIKPGKVELDPDTKARFEAGLRNDDKGWQPVRELVDLIKEDRAEEERAIRDEYLRQLAESKRPVPPIRPYSTAKVEEEKISTTNPDGKNIAIPVGLTEEEKQLVKSFYNL